MDNTIVFKISKENDFSKLNASTSIRNFIADLSGVDANKINLLKDKFITFDKLVSKNKGSFVIVYNFDFDENLNIVPSLQEAYDFIDMEEIERQLEI